LAGCQKCSELRRDPRAQARNRIRKGLLVRVAVAQFASQADAGLNRTRAVSLMRKAAEDGAELVVLPEASMYPLDRPASELAGVAESLEGPFVSALVEAAAELSLTAVAGLFEKVPDENRVHNTVVAVCGSGLLGRYRKLHLYDALGYKESDALLPGRIDGDEILVLALDELVVGVATCYDLRFPELFRVLADRGATVFAVPAAWVAGPLKVDQWITMCRARAIENTSYLLAAAQPPPAYCGRSLVLDPMGVELAGLGDDAGVATAEISAERVRSVRAVLAQRRYDVRPRDVEPKRP
jgi:predicted amidohydrolase